MTPLSPTVEPIDPDLDLVGASEPSESFECGRCGNGTNALTTSSRLGAAQEFFAEGWRVDEDEVKCPECGRNSSRQET